MMKHLLLLLFFGLFGLCRSAAQVISSFPYVQDFETTSGAWFDGGVSSDWAYGTPAKARINSAGSGTKCWISGGVNKSAYNSGEKSWVQSPEFDFTFLSNPAISFLIFWDTEQQYDGGNLQYSTDNGVSWANVGTANTPGSCLIDNWFNRSGINNLGGLAFPLDGWSGNTLSTSGSCQGGGGLGKWVLAKHCLNFLGGTPSVLFRFTFCSGSTCNNYDGIAFDSVSIYEQVIPTVQTAISCIGSAQFQAVANAAGCEPVYNWDFGEPGSAGNIQSGDSVQHTYQKSGDYTVSFTADLGCGITVGEMHPVSIPDVTLQVYPVSCVGKEDGAAVVKVSHANNPLVSWDLSPPVISDSIGDLGVGKYNYVVSSSDPGGCSVSGSAAIVYGPDAFPQFDLGPDRRICPGDSVLVNVGVFTSYRWNDGSVESSRYLSIPGDYSITVTNQSGCELTDSIRVIESCGNLVWLPRSFTPNNDTHNDLWKATVGSTIQNWTLKIYNRFGQLVFESSNPEEAWDGNWSGKAAPQGVYVYSLDYRLEDLKRHTVQGVITLLR